MVVDTPSGLQYDDVAEGSGAQAKPGQKARVHYTGTLVDSKKLDS
jgi:FKBP-type peptidyl-prolyl cis-trans isomerase FkpA